MTPGLAMTDTVALSLAGVLVAVLLGFLTLYYQNRQQQRSIGTANGRSTTGTVAGDVAELRGEVKARNREVDRRLAALDRGQREILRRLPDPTPPRGSALPPARPPSS